MIPLIRLDDCMIVPSKLPVVGMNSKILTCRLFPWFGIVMHRKRDGTKRLEDGVWK